MGAKHYKHLRDGNSIDATNFGCPLGCHGTGIVILENSITGEQKQAKCTCEQWRNNPAAENFPTYQSMKGNKEWTVLR